MGFGVTVATDGISLDDWKLYFSALAAFLGMIELPAVKSWLDEELTKNRFIENKANLVLAVMLDAMMSFLYDNHDKLRLPEKVKKAVKRYLIDDDDRQYYEEFDNEKKELPAKRKKKN